MAFIKGNNRRYWHSSAFKQQGVNPGFLAHHIALVKNKYLVPGRRYAQNEIFVSSPHKKRGVEFARDDGLEFKLPIRHRLVPAHQGGKDLGRNFFHGYFIQELVWAGKKG